ncbi:MAG: CIA30 family protein [Anaerolineae bacterium]
MKNLRLLGWIGFCGLYLSACQQVTPADLPVSQPIAVPTKATQVEVAQADVAPVKVTESEAILPATTDIPPTQPPIEPTPTVMSTPTSEPTFTPTAEPTSEPTAQPLPGSELFTFTAGEPGWYTVDDNVMGGVSSSTVAIAESSQLYFSGDMSLENNGGFSSVRSDWQINDLTGFDGVLLRVKGDGKVYRLRIRTDSVGRSISYNALFKTTAETWTTVFVPFAEMVPTYRGFIMDVGPLDPATIGSFGFMLSDKQPGEFELTVDWMRAVSAGDIQIFADPLGG